MEKIRKAKVITALSLTVVMLAAMTGIAAATGFDIDPYQFTIPDDSIGGEVEVTVTWTGSVPVTAAWHIQKKINGVWNDNDEVNAKTGSEDYASSGNQGFAANEEIVYLVKDVGGEDSQPTNMYRIQFWNVEDSPENADEGEFVVTGKGEINVPEFTTIAMPVAAIFGLVLFFNHRKHKKE